ncbi:hypothetical protein [Burkholderia sp. Ac-20392]|uniref:hypothetical protein n=1 Tax=Burkholderia sp. Ac-20392 TaxID=2703905 RepID=UPI00197CD9B0|nr:hypothetical protein [Burkholderia sp. Ac-20392]MBN3794104.1 hypothetical protein [Burkholderia sp. Ac-20392]
MKRGLGVMFGLLAAVHCTGSLAVGILKLSRTEMTVVPDREPGDLWVENRGNTPLYLDVTQQLVANPGHMPEKLVPVEEVLHPGLLIMPRRVTISPGQKTRVMLKVLDVPRRTQIWRVTFRPRERIVVDTGDATSGPAPLFIGLGYGVLIYHKKIE